MNILQEPVQFKDTTDYNNEPLQYTDVNPQEGEMALVEPSGYALKHRYGEYGYQDEDDASNIDTVCTVITLCIGTPYLLSIQYSILLTLDVSKILLCIWQTV